MRILALIPGMNGASTAPSFGIIQPDNGTSPTASAPDDTLTLTSSDGSVTITGNSGAKSVNFAVGASTLSGSIAGATLTFTNKRITKTVITLSTGVTSLMNWDTGDVFKMTTNGSIVSVANPSGTPTDFQMMELCLTVGTTNTTVFFGTAFKGSTDLPLPTNLSGISFMDRMIFQYNTDRTLAHLIGKVFGGG